MSSQILKHYIRLLLTEANKSLPELETHYADDIQSLNKNFFAQQEAQVHGWADLNDLIHGLRSIPDNYEINSPQDKMYWVQQTLQILGYQPIGQGFYRQVYSQPSTPWVIKLQLRGHINAREHDTYFAYGQTGDWVRYDLFPKLYDMDPDGAMWSIWEKVTPFTARTESRLLHTMFPLFTQQLIHIHQQLNIPDLKPFHQPLHFGKHILPLLQDVLHNNPVSNPTQLTQRYHELMATLLPQFQLEMNAPYINGRQLRQILAPLPFPKDLQYLYDFFNNAEGYPQLLNDLKADNLGYRNLTDNPKEPWRNLIILDLGEF